MTDAHIIAYLLEELPEEELERFEDECFAEESWPAQLSLVEEDLIDAYLRDELTPEQRQRFEQNYLTTEARQERVIMAAALMRHVDEKQAQATVTVPPTEQTWTERFRAFWNNQNWALRATLTSAVVVIIVGGLWLSLYRRMSPRTFANLTLTSTVSNRAEGVRADKVKLPLSADALKIFLTLPERLPPAISYRVELEKENGVTKPLEIAEQDARFVSVVIPAAQLERGQYALTLSFIKPDGTELPFNNNYFFNVE